MSSIRIVISRDFGNILFRKLKFALSYKSLKHKRELCLVGTLKICKNCIFRCHATEPVPFFYILCTKYLYVGTNFINVAIWLTVNIITIDDFKMGQTNNDHQVSIQ